MIIVQENLGNGGSVSPKRTIRHELKQANKISAYNEQW